MTLLRLRRMSRRPGPRVRGHALLLLMGAVFVGAESSAQPIPDRPDLGLRVWQESSAEGLELRGIVVDGESGHGLAGAQVFFEGTDTGALTNARGEFLFRASAPGLYRLVIQLIGYASVSGEVEVRANGGLEVQATMAEQDLAFCDVVCAWPGCESGVRVEIRDVETGVAPQVEVALDVIGSSGSSSISGVAPPLDSAYLANHRNAPLDAALGDSIVNQRPIRLSTGGDLGSDGPVNARVTAVGYHPWEADGVWLLPRGCLPRASRLLKVWLQPIG